MTIEFIKVAIPQVDEREVEAVREVLLSGNYVSGAKVKKFEDRFAEYIGTRYAVAVSNGTAALHIALEAFGISKNDEVIVPPMTFFATISSVLYLGAKPVFADIDIDDLCLSPQSIEDKITSKTKAIIPVHLFGAASKMEGLIQIAQNNNLTIVEDCAQAHGTEYNGEKVGSIGNAGAFSFFATKHMTTGEGGMITTNDENVANQCKIIRSHGMTGRDDHIRLGYNHRMTEMEAAMGLVQLNKLDQFNNKRIENSEYIISAIKELPWAEVPVPTHQVKHTYFWCPLMVKASSGQSIKALKEHLTSQKIGFRQRYIEPLYKQPVLKKLGLDYSKVHLPNAEKISGNIIGLPNHPGLTRDDLDRIIATIYAFRY